MRKLMICLATTGLMTAPAMAETLDHVIAKGIVLEIEGGIEIPVTYSVDGTYVADVFGESIPGVWRIEEDGVLCTKAEVEPEETCAQYPFGKEPGDSFEMTGPAGTAIIHINE